MPRLSIPSSLRLHATKTKKVYPGCCVSPLLTDTTDRPGKMQARYQNTVDRLDKPSAYYTSRVGGPSMASATNSPVHPWLTPCVATAAEQQEAARRQRPPAAGWRRSRCRVYAARAAARGPAEGRDDALRRQPVRPVHCPLHTPNGIRMGSHVRMSLTEPRQFAEPNTQVLLHDRGASL